MTDNTISLNKFISSSGFCSRREADEWISWGLVLINGQAAKKGNRVTHADVVTVDGVRIKHKVKPIYIAFHKPPGITCTTDQNDKDNIIDFIKHKQRIFPIGRLDKASSGLILLTNDGNIVNKILREENNHEKEYIVKVNNPVHKGFIQKMERGVPILGTKTKKCRLKQLSATTFSIILTQGLNRQIRRMCEFLGYKVMTLKRIRIMDIELGQLPIGHWRDLTTEELNYLKKHSIL